MLPFDPLLTMRILGTRVSTNVSTLVVICLMSGGVVAALGSGSVALAEWSLGTLAVLTCLIGAIALHAGARLFAYRSMGISVPQVHLLSVGRVFQRANLERSPRPGSIAGVI